MQEHWPRQPLILTPQLPLIWVGSYWSIGQMFQQCGQSIGQPSGDQVEMALMLAFVWIGASAYNQLLIYQNIPITGIIRYKNLAIGNALTLICTIILAWGKPAVILFPRHLTVMTGILTALAILLATLGNYFVASTRRLPDRLPLWLGPITIILTMVVIPLFFTLGGHGQAVLAAILVITIQAGHFWQLPQLLTAVLARRSGFYNVLIGADLAALIASIPLGIVSEYQLWNADVIDRLSICWGIALLSLGINTLIIAAMQRYHNDYRYGHAEGYENWFVAIGALLWVVLLVGLILVIK
ncbi:MAG: hypothetical protein ACLRX6_08160 [Limosilactobacillus pontis]|nr:hypothetical protein [Limosilactobacillus pontis]